MLRERSSYRSTGWTTWLHVCTILSVTFNTPAFLKSSKETFVVLKSKGVLDFYIYLLSRQVFNSKISTMLKSCICDTIDIICFNDFTEIMPWQISIQKVKKLKNRILYMFILHQQFTSEFLSHLIHFIY